MTIDDLKFCDIIVVDHNISLRDGRPVCYYVVTVDPDDGRKVAVSFNGECNGGPLPSGWYDLSGEFGSKDLPFGTVAVYRPKFFGWTFSGDFYNEEKYEVLFRAEGYVEE